jgi:hypothetical protein
MTFTAMKYEHRRTKGTAAQSSGGEGEGGSCLAKGQLPSEDWN